MKGKWGKLSKKATKNAKAKAPKSGATPTMTDGKKSALDYLDAIDDPDLMKPILSLALPSKILLFKIMRACIAVKKKEDLWMFVNPLGLF